jgi:predicted cobalt transporter CbtA
MLKTAVVVGLIAGLLVGGLHNIVTVPVIEEAIALEEAVALAAGEADGAEPVVSLGAQRVGLAFGQGIFGVVVGALFAAFTYAARRFVAPDSARLAMIIAGVVGFWAISLLPALRYPANPPGVGEAVSLAWRQGFQLAFLVLSATASVAYLVVLSRARAHVVLIAGVSAGYLAIGVLLFSVFPENPDPVHAPADLVREFRILTVAGHALLWGLIVVGTVAWSERRQASKAIGAR